MKVVEISSAGEADARRAFSEHVQSVAFQISLSKRMVDMLREVRDYGFPHLGTKYSEAEWQEHVERKDAVSLRFHKCEGGRKEKARHCAASRSQAGAERGLIAGSRAGTPFPMSGSGQPCKYNIAQKKAPQTRGFFVA